MLKEAALYHRHFDGTLYPLNHKESNLPILSRVILNGESCYIPQGKQLNKQNPLRSVSNILKLTQEESSKEALREWMLRVGQKEANRIRNEAVKAGNAIHAYIHSHLIGKKAKPVDKPYQNYLQSLNTLLPNFGETLLSEQFVVSFKYRYFGKIDHLGFYRKTLTLSDFKTSIKPKLSINWVQDKIIQLAAYYIPVETLYPVEQAALIYLINDGSYNEFLLTPQQMKFYKELWLERLSQASEIKSLAAS